MESADHGNSSDLVETEVSYKGSKIIGYKIKGSPIFVCPICRMSYFYNESDLMNHIIAHSKGYIEKRRGTPNKQFRRREED